MLLDPHCAYPRGVTLLAASLGMIPDARGLGVDLFKLESAIAAAEIPPSGDARSTEVQHWFDRLGRAAGRAWVMLSPGAGMLEFERVIYYAYRGGASGYLAGRAIWHEALDRFPDWRVIQAELAGERRAYMRALNARTDAEARPRHHHPCYGDSGPRVLPADAGFRQAYDRF